MSKPQDLGLACAAVCQEYSQYDTVSQNPVLSGTSLFVVEVLLYCNTILPGSGWGGRWCVEREEGGQEIILKTI